MGSLGRLGRQWGAGGQGGQRGVLCPGLPLCRLPQTRGGLVVPGGVDRWPRHRWARAWWGPMVPNPVFLYELGPCSLCLSKDCPAVLRAGLLGAWGVSVSWEGGLSY